MDSITLLGSTAESFDGNSSVGEMLIQERFRLGELCLDIWNWLKGAGKTDFTLGELLPPNEESHVHSLEDVCDRLQIFLYLSVDFISQIPKVSEVFGKGGQPKTEHWAGVSILAEKLWRRLQVLHHLTIGLSGDARGATLKEECAQTEGSWCCESCTTSQTLIRMLVAKLLGMNRPSKSAVSAYREKMKEGVYKMSQLAAMKGWCKAILQDIDKMQSKNNGDMAWRRMFSAKVRFLKRERQLRRKLISLKVRLHHALIRTTTGGSEEEYLKEENLLLKENITNFNDKINVYKNKLHEYGEAILTLNRMKERFIETEENNRSEIEKLKLIVNSRRKDLKECVNRDQSVLERKLDELRRINEKNQQEINYYKNTVGQLEERIGYFNKNTKPSKHLITDKNKINTCFKVIAR